MPNRRLGQWDSQCLRHDYIRTRERNKGNSRHSPGSPSSIMAALLSALALLSTVNAQAYDGGERAPDAFSYVQPLNTTILNEYNSSPAVYPSRKYQSILESFHVPRNQIRSRGCRRLEHSSNMTCSKHHRNRWLGGCFGEGSRFRRPAHHRGEG